MQQPEAIEKRNRRLLALFAGVSVILVVVYVFWGLNASNWDFNLPRRLKKVLAIALVAYAVGHSTLVFQTITSNNILTPSIMGLDSLYLFFQTTVVFLFGSRQLSLMNDVPSFLITLALMLGAALLLFMLMFRGAEKNVYFLVLVGMIFGTLFGGLTNFMQMLIDPNEFSVLQGKMFASFNKVNTDLLWISIGIAAVVFLASLLDLRKLDVLALGRNHAINLGVNYTALVLRSLMLVAVLTSVATVLVGPVSFLGILVISLTRTLFKTYRHATLLAGVSLISVAVLMLGMLVTERLMNFSVPLSVIVNFVGGLYFILLLLKENKK